MRRLAVLRAEPRDPRFADRFAAAPRARFEPARPIPARLRAPPFRMLLFRALPFRALLFRAPPRRRPARFAAPFFREDFLALVAIGVSPERK